MISDELFEAGLLRIATAVGLEATEKTLEFYSSILRPEMDDGCWLAVVASIERDPHVVKLPTPGQLIERARVIVDGPVEALAVRAYDAVEQLFENGKHGWREIHAKLGRAAADAFVAAGGARAFSWCSERDEPFRRKAFIDAFKTSRRADPQAALPPGQGRLPALPKGDPDGDVGNAAAAGRNREVRGEAEDAFRRKGKAGARVLRPMGRGKRRP